MTGEAQHPTEDTDRAAWFAAGLQAIAERARRAGTFAAYDLASGCALPEPPHPNCWGVLFGRARAQGLIVSVAAVPSSRPKTARSLVRLWVGARYADTEEAA